MTHNLTLDLTVLVPAVVGAFTFGTLASLVFGARLMRVREDGTTSIFSVDGDAGGDGGCGGGCGD